VKYRANEQVEASYAERRLLNLLKLLSFRAVGCSIADPALLSRLLISTEAERRVAASILIVGCSFVSCCKAAIDIRVCLTLS
jgi:hypothetical protein